jgi:hypothetical protein
MFKPSGNDKSNGQINKEGVKAFFKDQKTKNMLEFFGNSKKDLNVILLNSSNLNNEFDKQPYKEIKGFVVFVSSLIEPCCTITRGFVLKKEIENKLLEVGNKLLYSDVAFHCFDNNDYLVFLRY